MFADEDASLSAPLELTLQSGSAVSDLLRLCALCAPGGLSAAPAAAAGLPSPPGVVRVVELSPAAAAAYVRGLATGPFLPALAEFQQNTPLGHAERGFGGGLRRRGLAVSRCRNKSSGRDRAPLQGLILFG